MISNMQDLGTRFRAVGQAGGEPIALTVEDLVFSSEDGARPRLWLPPIQRSLVWDNQRIIQFWDSLFRGYPIGMMLVHPPQPHEALEVGNHRLNAPKEGDLALFDGQQRLHALRLGYGLVDDPVRKLWIDLGQVNEWVGNGKVDRELCLPLRISGPGQPFGYDAAKPNSKYGADKQRQVPNEVRPHRAKVWRAELGPHLIDADMPVPLEWFFTVDGEKRLRDERYPTDSIATVRKMTDSLRQSQLLFVPVPSQIVSKPQDYQRFFERIGRGGVSLSDKELAYSIIKQRLPHVRAHMEGIEGVGRIADEVDLVLGCFRIARTLEDKDDRDTWRRTNYPRAEDLKQFSSAATDGATTLFKRFLPLEYDAGLLKILFETLSSDLCGKTNDGLPRLLLPHINGELWHVLLLLRYVENVARPSMVAGPHKLSTFVLWWLLFVVNEEKAAQEVFARARQKLPLELPALVRAITDKEKTAHPVLSEVEHLAALAEIKPNADLLAWDKRFGNHEHLRRWADDRRIRQRALIWLQRGELAEWGETKDFDPASDNEDDLPIEFDHLIPQSKWAFHWSDSRVDQKQLNGFRHGRWHCGNAIGNFRILTSSQNASRGDAPLTCADIEELRLDLHPEAWIALSSRTNDGIWSLEDIRAFQFLTHRRTLQLYARLLKESGISALFRAADTSTAAVSTDGPAHQSTTG